MRRTSLLLVLLTLLALASSASASQDGATPPPLKATVAACASGPTPDERFAIFTASMPARRGTHRMAVRFDLFERGSSTGAWQRLAAPGFGRWIRSKPARAGFVWTKRVERLAQAMEYRAVVRFRWYGAGGDVQRQARRTTTRCRQPDQRPDLEVESIGVAPGPDAATNRYLVTIVNAGRTAAGAFEVGLVAAADERVRAVPGLGPGERTTVEIVGARCSGADTVSARADVRGVVEESEESDNAQSRSCGGR